MGRYSYGGRGSGPTKAQDERYDRFLNAISRFQKTVRGYKILKGLMPTFPPIQVGDTLKDCHIISRHLMEEGKVYMEKLTKKIEDTPLYNLKTPKKKVALKTDSQASKKQIINEDVTTKKLVDTLTMEEINKATPYKLKKLKNGDYAIMLGALHYMRFDGIVWARYYCETLNSGYRDILRDLKESTKTK